MTATEQTTGSTCLPRFATPRDLRFPTLGGELGEVARRLGTPLMPWQQDAADVAFEFDPVTGLLRYDEVDITVPRQSGKTTLTLAKKVHRLTVMAKKLGPQRSTYTAQTRLAARKKLERDFAEALRTSRSFREVPHARARPTKATEWRLTLNNGSEAIQFGSGSFLQIDAPSRTGGHGDTLDDGTIDEAFSQEDDTVEGAMRPAMATRRNAQLWVISTAGDSRSAYLWRKVLAGREATESENHGRVCYIEYSAPDDADPADPATWHACMPALGRTVTEEFVQGEWDRAQRKGGEGVDTFCRAYLNQWPVVPTLKREHKGDGLNLELWAASADPDAPRGTDPVFGVAVAPDRSWSAIGVAWERADGRVQAMLADYRPSTEWLDGRVAGLRRDWSGRVVVNTAAKGLIASADEPTQSQQAQAHTTLDNLLRADRFRHGNEPALNTAARAARWKPFGDTQILDRKGTADISPLDAVALAVHARAATHAEPFVIVT